MRLHVFLFVVVVLIHLCVKREIERQHNAAQEKQMLDKAVKHHHRALLLHHGLVPLKRLLEKSQTYYQVKTKVLIFHSCHCQ